jgi:hypothetical protein
MVLVNKARRWIKLPTTIHQTNEIKSGFYNKAGIRNIIGIVDGSHINISFFLFIREVRPPSFTIEMFPKTNNL